MRVKYIKTLALYFIFGRADEAANATRELAFWTARAQAAEAGADPQPPPPKKYKPKHMLPAVTDYSKPASAAFWAKFPTNTTIVGKSSISATRLRSLANALGCADWDRLELVCKDLENGADIGCKGEPRLGTFSSNAPSVFDHPAEVTDAVADWVAQGFAKGPLDPKDRPGSAKVNGMMCRTKPNGSARIILNLSAPAGRAVNDGINNDEFPTSMSSTAKWLEVINKAGRNGRMCKIDWAAAYKHIAVRKEDINLQYFSWLGQDFAELMLVFGGRSSAGIFDRAAKVVLDLVIRYARFDPNMVCQYLDDTCAASGENDPAIEQFDRAFRAVAADVGVQLAPTDDPDKAFAPTTQGTVLGVHYNTTTWKWSIPTDKWTRLLGQIRAATDAEHITQHDMWSLAGRILHYAPLIPAGKFNIHHILKASAASTDRNATVGMTGELRRQLFFWWIMLKTTNGLSAIPPPIRFPAWTLEYYTDAAGGSTTTSGNGTGGIGGKFWFMVPWGRKINSGMKGQDGKRFSRKLSALELVGPLICVASDYERSSGSPIRIWVDNAGSIAIWRKGYSTNCALCTAIATAIGTVAAKLRMTVTIDKITRCSNAGAILADELSKGQHAAFKRKLPTDWALDPEPAWIPSSILAWIADPTPDDTLGDKILADIRERQQRQNR